METRKADLLKLKNKELLEYEKVFFVHYQCNDFNEGEQITALCIYSNGKAKEYSGNEAENIKEYADKVNELFNKGLFLVHWNQDRPNYGTDHINKRYFDLTGNHLELEYSNEINLAEWLIFKYGQNYISHPRLDNLAKLNEFYGIRETELGQRTFATNRVLLLTKIYFNALNNTLKTDATPIVKALPPQPIVESPFSVLEWATIFYYADETKLLSESRLLKTRLEQFMSKHQVNTTPVNFKNSYYEAKRRINEKNDYPINKLELIIPFLKENYKQTVTKVENDIIFLEENKPEY